MEINKHQQKWIAREVLKQASDSLKQALTLIQLVDDMVIDDERFEYATDRMFSWIQESRFELQPWISGKRIFEPGKKV